MEAVVRDVPGTTPHRAGITGRVPAALGIGGDYPQASVQMHDDHARVVVDVACAWPGPVADVARRVRDDVISEASRLAGVEISDVDVIVHPATPDTDPEGSRVR